MGLALAGPMINKIARCFDMEEMKTLVLGEPITLDDFVSVARFGRKVEFSPEYIERVERSRALVEQWVEEERVMYRWVSP